MPGGVLLLLLIVAAVVVLGLPMTGLGFFPPWNATTVARVNSGKITIKRGQLRGQVRDDLEEVLNAAGVISGFIALTSENRIHFSRNIPEPIRQRLRNVLLN
jgi:hypothetical protein